MLVVNDRPLLVPYDVIAVQTVAVLVKIILTFRTGIFFDAENSLTDFCRVGRAGLVDRSRQDGDGVVRPGALVIRRRLVGVAIGFAEGLGRLAGVFRVIRHAVGPETGRAPPAWSMKPPPPTAIPPREY